MTDPKDRSSSDDQSEIEIQDFDVPDHFGLREHGTVRNRLATGVFLLIAVLTLLLVCSVIFGKLSIANAKELKEDFLSPILVIFVAIISFFFGKELRSR
jgi:hypothetical protein